MMRGMIVVAALALAAALSSPSRADLKSGLDAYYGERYDVALAELRPLAEAGDPSAQTRLGNMYNYGKGVDADPVAAARWFEMAALQGYAEAQFALGVMYQYGRGVKWNHGQGWWWMRQAANQGYLDALHWIVNSGECGSC